jgi:replicative DNA helicase
VIAETPPPALGERAHAIAAALIAELARRPDATEAEIAGLLTLHTGELADLIRSVAADKGGPLVRQVGDGLAAELLADFDARAQAASRNGGVVGVRSGIGHLDETLNGLEAGKLYILAAMPGCGKTTLALQMAATVAQAGRPALYLSLENDAADLARKCACRLGNVSYAAALKGKLTSAAWQVAVGKLAELGGRLYLSTPRETIPDLGDLMEVVKEKAGEPPALLVVDYLQAWVKRAAGADADLRQHIDRFTPALRALGERYGCAVLAISSQNRSGYYNGGMASLKESGDIEYSSDVTMVLARATEKLDKNGQPTGAPLPPNVSAVCLTVEKNRQGLTGKPLWMALHGDRCLLEEIVT